MSKRKNYLEFIPLPPEQGINPQEYAVKNKRGYLLGIIEKDKYWVFIPRKGEDLEVLLSWECLDQISEFLKELESKEKTKC